MKKEIMNNILEACANDREVYFYIFEALEEMKINNGEIIEAINELINKKYLECWNMSGVAINKIEANEYENYKCKTIDEHIDKYDYGPHEFKTTEIGLNQIK